uniref:Caspase-8 n=1 Tax=Lethenteron camtschaticum TaxID=980415 RepID=C8CIH9_LETCA|nr:caspase-8 [Lethenteron camtschaticum]
MSFNYRKVLTAINGELVQRDLQGLRFLCKDMISSSLLENASALQIFDLLEKRDKLSKRDTTLLAELLHHLQRKDLLRKFNLAENWQQETGLISDFRILLYTLANNLTMTNYQELVFYYAIPRSNSSDNSGVLQCIFELFVELEKRAIICSENLLKLKEGLKSLMRNDLVKRIDNYTQIQEKLQEQQSHSLQTPIFKESFGHNEQTSWRYPGPHSQESMGVEAPSGYEGEESSRMSQDAVRGDPHDPIIHQVSPPAQRDHMHDPTTHSTDLPAYPVKNNPRGICLIINNEAFSEDFKTSPKLKRREGTHIDAEKLEQVFKYLGFKILLHNNLTVGEMKETLISCSNMNHQNHDVFVCCILTHGEINCVFGSDGKSLMITQVTSYFNGSACKSLLGKPKLFFIQACQGHEKQSECYLAADADIDADGPVSPISYSIPDEADILLGMATVSGYLSFRHRREGSWYIQTLCNLLEQKCNGKNDILAILTDVNRVVAEKTARMKNPQTHRRESTKQMPQPKFSLRMKLFLSPPNDDLSVQDHHPPSASDAVDWKS